MNEDTIGYLIVVHRALSCNDEAATLEEQSEKILYFYPEGTTLNDQLNKINMLEGLIEFTGKFSAERIDTVVMEKYTW